MYRVTEFGGNDIADTIRTFIIRGGAIIADTGTITITTIPGPILLAELSRVK